ncbi:MAG TPA: polysaccharide biosynthesis/export family protein [Opitutaceae bacterium]|nr:polysaccharide biosynthesis/export family protein [Opitutaceae bacterium]
MHIRIPSLIPLPCKTGPSLRAAAAACLALAGAAFLRAQDGAPRLDGADYRIVPRDELKFQVTGETEDPLLQRVTSAGEVSIPLLGAVKVSGLTLREAESQIEKRYLDGGFYIKPQVILSFNSYGPRTVSVLGQVNNPSSIDFPIEREQMGIVSAITKAGGFTRVARPDTVKVTRTVDGKESVFTVNVTAYLSDTSKEQEFKLLPDDIVFVPERVF